MESEVPIYNLNQPFIVELEENPTTGYHWVSEMTSGLKIITTVYTNRCPPGILGCGGIRSWVLAGIERGLQQFVAHYIRPGDLEPAKTKILTVKIY